VNEIFALLECCTA